MCERHVDLASRASEEGSWQTKVISKHSKKQAHYIETCYYICLFPISFADLI
jgi:hypothetical protein